MVNGDSVLLITVFQNIDGLSYGGQTCKYCLPVQLAQTTIRLHAEWDVLVPARGIPRKVVEGMGLRKRSTLISTSNRVWVQCGCRV